MKTKSNVVGSVDGPARLRSCLTLVGPAVAVAVAVAIVLVLSVLGISEGGGVTTLRAFVRRLPYRW